MRIRSDHINISNKSRWEALSWRHSFISTSSVCFCTIFSSSGLAWPEERRQTWEQGILGQVWETWGWIIITIILVKIVITIIIGPYNQHFIWKIYLKIVISNIYFLHHSISTYINKEKTTTNVLKIIELTVIKKLRYKNETNSALSYFNASLK